MNLRAVALLVMLVLVAAGSWWLLRQTSLQEMQKAQPKPHTADYYFSDATITSLDAQGHPQSVITGPRMLHHPDDDSLEIFTPHLRYLAADGSAWETQADHAFARSGGHLVQLDGHVALLHPGVDGALPLVINTDRMTLDLDGHLAHTDDAVVLVQGSSRINSIGMQIFLDDNRLVLQASVRGQYGHRH